MNIKALKAFRLVFSEGSVAAASEVMHLSQPAISRLISGLEAEIRLQLFDRSGRSLTPTTEGVAFYREAGRILDNLDEIPRITSEIRAGRTESLRIVTMPRIAQFLSAPAVALFTQENSEVSVTLDVRARREAGKWLAGREYDIGIAALPVSHPDIKTIPLVRVRALAILPAGHPLAHETSITAGQLSHETIIRLMQGLLLRDQLDDTFNSAGVMPEVTHEVSSSELACALVAEGAGVTIADEMVANSFGDRVVGVPIEPERWMTFGLLIPKHQRPRKVAELFEKKLVEHIYRVCRSNDNMRSVVS
ncbi:LysR family transcriptional regulator [Loktanella sp. Alg231-35]|uniref:LysR family transcriptional regulator n=1 Tax=Loktanella sp. Alg231-35 TaxID=1922220 RepID=UPI000D55749E|nr:LysR family transcriptional regulator [Loktanella sp. Alg231-35]